MLFQTIASTGALQNLSSLSSIDADLEIVQLHVRALGQGSLTGAMTVRGTAFPGTGKTVTVRKFSDLKGLSVALVGSARLMGQKLESQLGYGMLFLVADTDDDALAVLRAIEVQAVFTLGGCPVVPARRQRRLRGRLHCAITGRLDQAILDWLPCGDRRQGPTICQNIPKLPHTFLTTKSASPDGAGRQLRRRSRHHEGVDRR